MIKQLKQIVEKIISYIKLQINKCLIKKDIPLISMSVKIKNNKNIIFNGYSIIENHVLIKNKNGLIKMDENIYIRRFSKIQNIDGNITIGSNTTINEFSIIQSNKGSISIGKDVRIAPYVKIFAENHIFKKSDIPIHKQGLSSKGIIIGNNVWIGTGSIILDGVTIGDNIVIGAGSVVTKSFKKNQVIAGNPAKHIKGI